MLYEIVKGCLTVNTLKAKVLRMAGKRKAIDDFTPYFGEIENKDMYTSLVDDRQAAP